MKKVIALLMAVILCMGAYACGSGEGETTKNGDVGTKVSQHTSFEGIPLPSEVVIPTTSYMELPPATQPTTDKTTVTIEITPENAWDYFVIQMSGEAEEGTWGGYPHTYYKLAHHLVLKSKYADRLVSAHVEYEFLFSNAYAVKYGYNASTGGPDVLSSKVYTDEELQQKGYQPAGEVMPTVSGSGVFEDGEAFLYASYTYEESYWMDFGIIIEYRALKFPSISGTIELTEE